MTHRWAALQLLPFGQSVCAFSASVAEEHHVTLQCVTLDFDTMGGTAMGNTAMGNTAMGNIAMGNTAMGNTAVSLLRVVPRCATCFCLARGVHSCKSSKEEGTS